MICIQHTNSKQSSLHAATVIANKTVEQLTHLPVGAERQGTRPCVISYTKRRSITKSQLA